MASKVSSAAIQKIRQQGMAKSIAQYKAGQGDAEFKTAVERYYSPKFLKGAEGAGAATAKAVKEKQLQSEASGMGHKYDLVKQHEQKAQQVEAAAKQQAVKAEVGPSQRLSKPAPKPARKPPPKAVISRRIAAKPKVAAKATGPSSASIAEASASRTKRQEKEEALRGGSGEAYSPATTPISSSKPASNAGGSSVLGRRNAAYVSRNVSKPVGGALSSGASSTKGARKAAKKSWTKNVGRGFSRAFNV